MAVRVTMVLVVRVTGGWNHPKMLYYNITDVHGLTRGGPREADGPRDETEG